MSDLELQKKSSGFDEIRTARREFAVELNGALPLTDLRDDKQTSGTGAITDNESEFRVQHAAAGDFARLSSAKRGSYQPGTSLQAGIGVRLDTSSISGDGKGVWGYFDMDTTNTESIKNGFVYGLDKDGFFVEIIKDESSVHKTYQSNFNINSGADIDLTDGNIFQINFTYYGYGMIKFQWVKDSDGASNQEVIDLHSVRLRGETSISNPNLPVGALAKSSATTGDFSIYVGGRQISTIGQSASRNRISSARVEGKSIGASFEPILTFRKKEAFRDVNSDVHGFSCLSDQDIVLQMRIGADITGGTSPSFGNLSEQPAGETSFEVDTSATAIDTGTGVKVYETLVSGGEKNNSQALSGLGGLPAEIPDEGQITFAAKHLGSAATIDFVGHIEESF